MTKAFLPRSQPSPSRTLLYSGLVAVLNLIPEWIVIFSATMVAAALTNIKVRVTG